MRIHSNYLCEAAEIQVSGILAADNGDDEEDEDEERRHDDEEEEDEEEVRRVARQNPRNDR